MSQGTNSNQSKSSKQLLNYIYNGNVEMWSEDRCQMEMCNVCTSLANCRTVQRWRPSLHCWLWLASFSWQFVHLSKESRDCCNLSGGLVNGQLCLVSRVDQTTRNIPTITTFFWKTVWARTASDVDKAHFMAMHFLFLNPFQRNGMDFFSPVTSWFIRFTYFGLIISIVSLLGRSVIPT